MLIKNYFCSQVDKIYQPVLNNLQMETLGQKIRNLRLKKGLSIKRLSILLKVNYTYISHIERDKSIPSEDILKKLARKLGADEEELKILSGKVPEDIKKLLYEHPVEAPLLIREVLSNYAASKQLLFSINDKKHLEQFFTPDNIASGMLEIIGAAGSNRGGRIIDPSCGDGVFLKTVKKENPKLKVFGCDIDSEPISLIKLQGIEDEFIVGDALKILLNHYHSFDFAVGNPPFSAQDNLISDRDILNNFQLGNGKQRQAVEILFLELFIRLLKRGGRFSIILPEGILSAKPQKYVRDWLASNTAIHSIISLPRNIFKKTSSKCVIISGEKNTTVNNVVKYAIFDGVNFSEAVNIIMRGSKNTIAQLDLIKLSDWRPENLQFVKMSRLFKGRRWVNLNELVEFRTGFVKYGKDRMLESKPKKESYQLIVAKNFLPVAGLNFDKVRYFISPGNPSFSTKAEIKQGEMLFVRVGVGCCGRIAVFDYDIKAQADDWIHIMTPCEGVNPWYISSWIASSFGQGLIRLISHGVGTVSISKSSLGQLLIPRLDKTIEEEIAGLFRTFTMQQISYDLWVGILDEIFRRHIKNLEGLTSLPTMKRLYPLQNNQAQPQLNVLKS